MTAIKARKCFVPRSPSHWVAKVFLTCDNILAVQFNRGQKVKKILAHGPGAYRGRGGVPHVCCLYPGTQGELAEQLYELAQVWAYGGEWVHAFLYKKFGYHLVQPPTMCGGCNTSCTITSNNGSPAVGDVVTFTATITNTDGSTTYGDAPQGTVTFSVDGTSIGTVTLPSNEPDSQNYETASITWTATSGTHTVEAAYTPSETDYAPTNCSLSVTVSGGGVTSGGGGVTSACCPNNNIPATLYATLSGSATGTIPLAYDSSSGSWLGSFGICGSTVSVSLVCMLGSGWNITLTGGAFWSLTPEQTSYTCNPFSVAWTGIAGTCSNNNDPVSVNISVTA